MGRSTSPPLVAVPCGVACATRRAPRLPARARTARRSSSPARPGPGRTRQSNVLGLDKDAWLVVDADKFKDKLLREAMNDGTYETFLKPDAVREREATGEPFFPLELAALVHEESSHLARLLRDEALREGTNVVIDSVLSNPARPSRSATSSRPPATRSRSSTSRSPTSCPRHASPNAGASPTKAPSSRGRARRPLGPQRLRPRRLRRTRRTLTLPRIRRHTRRHLPRRDALPALLDPSSRRAHACRDRYGTVRARGQLVDHSVIETRTRTQAGIPAHRDFRAPRRHPGAGLNDGRGD